tara:strand:- start:17 stop:298 length:282 start_codon:yes stop_codon:yes gene_type:complete
MNKKSQGLSINVIIIVAIALIVLVVLIAVFTGRLGNFTRGLGETASCRSSCTAFGMEKEEAVDAESCTPPNRYASGTYDDVTTGNVCCCKPSE